MLIRIAIAIRAHLIDHILGRGQMVDRTPSVGPADDVGEFVGWRLGRHFWASLPAPNWPFAPDLRQLRDHTLSGTTGGRVGPRTRLDNPGRDQLQLVQL